MPHRLYRMDVCFFERQSSNPHWVVDDWNQDTTEFVLLSKSPCRKLEYERAGVQDSTV